MTCGVEWLSIGLLLECVVTEGLRMIVDLFGSFPCTIENGRIKLPAPFCKALSIQSKQQIHLTRELPDCLYLYSQEQWVKRVEELTRLNMKEGGDERLRRIADKHHTVDVDKNGRMTIPQELREAGGLGKKVMVVGLFHRMEVWDFEAYERSLGRM